MSKQRGTSAQRAYAAAQPNRSDKTVAIKQDSPKVVTISADGMTNLEIHASLIHVHRLLAERQAQEVLMRRSIEEARELGATWQEIGDALDVSAQAAWEKYRARKAFGSKGARPGQAEELPFD